MKRKIAILDGHPLNPGDLSWSSLEKHGELSIFPRSTPEEAVLRSKGAEIIVINKVKLGKEEIKQLPELKYIAVTATGYNNVDAEALKARGILCSNIPDYGSFGVAQHAMALLLALTNRVALHHEEVKNDQWQSSGDFSFTKTPITELANKSIGLVGLGKIGYRMGVMAEAMGMYVHYFSREPRELSWEYHSSIESILRNSDVISLHIPLTPKTDQIINKDTLGIMKKGSILINTSRGQLINEYDLYHALEEGVISGAGLDVLSLEPPPVDHILLSARNCLITPHNAWASIESRGRIMEILEENISTYLEGNPVNLVG